MKKIYTFLLGAFIFMNVAQAQFAVKGTVRDIQNNSPIPGAAILIPHTAIAAVTDAQGLFSIQSPVNFDSIVVTFLGYVTQQLPVSDKSQALTILLEPSSRSLSNVEIIGVQQPQSVNTLGATELNRASGLRLQDALNDVPGVSMSARSPWGGQHIIIRGYYPSTDNGHTNSINFSGLGYQLYINDIPVTDASGSTVMDDIDMTSLESPTAPLRGLSNARPRPKQVCTRVGKKNRRSGTTVQ